MFLGRREVLAQFERLLDRLPDQGQVVVLRGDPGIGKSAVMDRVQEAAHEREVQVRRTSGVPSEAHTPYAGLQRLMQPYLDGLAGLPPAQAEALATAVGLRSAGTPPDAFKVALGSLELLADAASTAPLLLLVEDGHWLDQDSCEALCFLARRLEHEPIGLVCAVRTGYLSTWDAAGLPELLLAPLHEDEAQDLLDRHRPPLEPAVRSTVLRVAAGNPLALLELPVAYRAQPPTATATGSGVPMTDALQDAFLDRASGTSARIRTALVVAALDERASLDTVLEVAAAVAGEPVTTAELREAQATGLVELGDRLSFRHPLVAAALLHGATATELRAANAGLADVYADEPDRQAWYRAGACAGPDAHAAAGLLEAGSRALGRGAPAAAAAAFERAAELTADPVDRAGHLLRAADAQFGLGRPDLAVPLLRRAAPLAMSESDRAWLSLLLEAADEHAWSDPDRVAVFAGIAADMVDAWPVERAVHCLLTVAQGCWHAHPSQKTLDLVVGAARATGLPTHSPALLAVLGCTDPARQAKAVLEGLRHVPALPAADPLDLHMAGTAATTAWDFHGGMLYLAHAADGLRTQGRLGLLGQALLMRAWSALHIGNVEVARRCAEEASRLNRDSGQRIWAISADVVLATVAGERGELSTAVHLSQQAEAELVGLGGHPLLAEVAFARSRTAVAHQHYADAFERLRRLFDRTDVTHQPHVASWAYADFVEAAQGLGRRAIAERAFQELEALAAATDGPLLQAQVAYVRPLLATGRDAEALFEHATSGVLRAWPCYRTRAELAHGQWLRRNRRISDSRGPLRAAREGADALGLAGLAQLARQELRASGEGSADRRAQTWETLTPQEEQIAMLVAQGLSNKDIGQQLYLSHRTVASHLYRMFPKLGVSTRTQLAQTWTRRRGAEVAPDR